MIDLAIVGSGPCGAQAAAEAISAGLSVMVIDVGFVDDADLESSIPQAPFRQLRHTDPGQCRYFLGEPGDADADEGDRIGAHFTPPRSYMKRGIADLAPIVSTTFHPEQSFALGGLGAGWGAGSQTFEEFELARVGLDPEEMLGFYGAVSRDIGICGGIDDDTASTTLPPGVLRAADIDDNAGNILATYARKREAFQNKGFALGRAALAMLTESLPDEPSRGVNPYCDMDFYADFKRSVYRPRYTIEKLRKGARLSYVSGVLAEVFKESPEGVEITVRDVATGRRDRLAARRLLLAANPLNSARIALRSRGALGVEQPLLCNPYHYVPTVNVAMLGRPVRDRRHSLAQLMASYTPEHRGGEHVFAAFFSYRSLMHFRLVREMPLPPSLGLLASRALQTALTVVGVHHPESVATGNWVRLDPDGNGDAFSAHYEMSAQVGDLIARDLRGMRACLRMLGCVPISTIATPAGSSIHYAGTIPFAAPGEKATLTCDPSGRLSGSQAVFVADASSWRYLPAKGPTLTIMANARRVAREAARSLSA